MTRPLYRYNKDWETSTLEENPDGQVIVKVTSGGTPSTGKKEYWDGKISWLTPKEITDYKTYRYIKHTERNITEEGLKDSSAKLMPENTVMLTKRAPVGEVVINKTSMATNQGFLNFICGNKLIPEFLYYWFKANRPYLDVVANGSTYPELYPSDLFEFEIAYPTITEQKKITEILGLLDDKTELNQQMNNTLEAIGNALFSHWFVDFEFPNEEGKSYKTSGGEMVESELGKIPKKWSINSIDVIADFLNGLALQNFPPEDKDFLPVIKIRELHQDNTFDSDKAGSNIEKKYVVDDGDILFSWSGSLDVCIWGGGKGALNQHLFKVTSSEFEKWFYYHWLKYHLPEFRRIAEGKATTMGHIRRHHLSESLVLIPDRISLEKMNEIMNPLIEKIIVNKVENRNLSLTRDALLPKLMSGEIRVRVNT